MGLKNGSKLGFLTRVKLSTITQGSRECLVLVLKEGSEVTFSALAWYEEL